MADKSIKAQDTSQRNPQAGPDKNKDKDSGAELEEVSYGETATSSSIDQFASQQQQQRMQTAVLSGVVLALIDKDYLELLRDKQLRAQLDELAAAHALEKKKQQQKLASIQEPAILEKLATILGKPVAEKIQQTVKSLATVDGRTLHKDPTIVHKAIAEIVTAVDQSERCQQIGVTSEAVRKALHRQVAELRVTDRDALKKLISLATGTSADLKDLLVSWGTSERKEVAQQVSSSKTQEVQATLPEQPKKQTPERVNEQGIGRTTENRVFQQPSEVKNVVLSVYERLGALSAAQQLVVERLESLPVGDPSQVSLGQVVKRLEADTAEVQKDIEALFTREDVRNQIKHSQELREALVTPATILPELEKIYETLRDLPADHPQRAALEKVSKELEVQHSELTNSVERYVRRPEIQELLKEIPMAKFLVEEQGLHPTIAAAICEGREKLVQIMNEVETIDVRNTQLRTLLDTLATARLSPTTFVLIESRFAEAHERLSFEDALRAQFAEAPSTSLDASTVSAEAQLQATLAYLRDGRSESYMAERLLGLTRDTSLPSPELVRQAISCLQALDVGLERDVVSEIERRLGRSIDGSLGAWFVAEAKNRRGSQHVDVSSIELVSAFLEATAAAEKEGASPEDLAKFAAICIRLELLRGEPDSELIKSTLLAPPYIQGRDPSDEEMAKWVQLVSSVYRNQSGDSAPEWQASLDEVLELSSDLSLHALAAIIRGDIESGAEMLVNSEIDLQAKAMRGVDCAAIRHARAVAELETLVQLESDPNRKVVLEERIRQERARVAAYAADPALEHLFKISAIDDPAALGSHPLGGEFLLAAERIRQNATEAGVYTRLVAEASLDPDAILEDLSRRFATEEAARLFESSFREKNGYDLFDLLIRQSIGAPRWDALSLSERVAYRKEVLAESEAWRARERVLAATLTADQVSYLAAVSEVSLLQGDLAAFMRLKNVYSTLPFGMFEVLDGHLREKSSSLEELIQRNVAQQRPSDVAITAHDIAAWIRAIKSDNIIQAEALELRVLMMNVIKHGEQKVLEAQPLIEFLTREGFGATAQARIQGILTEYRNLYGDNIDLAEAFRVRAHPGGAAPTWPNDYFVIDAILRGNLRTAEEAAIERALYLRSDFKPYDGMVANVVMVEELNRLARLIVPERLTQIELQLSARLAEIPFWRDRGITSLSGYVAFCSGADWGNSASELFQAIMRAGGRGVPDQVLHVYLARFEAFKRGVFEADTIRDDLVHASTSFNQGLLLGARRNYEGSRKSYNESGGPVLWAMGYTEAARSQMESDLRTLRQAERLSSTMVHALQEYGAPQQIQFRENRWVPISATQDQGVRSQIVAQAQVSLRAVLQGELEISERNFQSAIAGLRRQFEPTEQGLSGAISERDVFFKDAMHRARQSGAAFESVVARCDTTITVLQTTRTVVLVGGAIIATGGLGAGVLVTSLSLTGVALGSRAIEGGGYYYAGLKDARSVTVDALRGTASDASKIVTAASLGGLGRSAWSFLGSGRAPLTAIRGTGLRVMSDARMHTTAIRDIGFRRWLNTRVVNLVSTEGGKTVYRRGLIELSKEVTSKGREISKLKDLPTSIKAMGKFVGDIKWVREIPDATRMKWVVQSPLRMPPIWWLTAPVYDRIEFAKTAIERSKPLEEDRKVPAQEFFGTRPSPSDKLSPQTPDEPALQQKKEEDDEVDGNWLGTKSLGGVFGFLKALFNARDKGDGRDPDAPAFPPTRPPTPPSEPDDSGDDGDKPKTGDGGEGLGLQVSTGTELNSYVAALLVDAQRGINASAEAFKQGWDRLQLYERLSEAMQELNELRDRRQHEAQQEVVEKLKALLEEGKVLTAAFVQELEARGVSADILTRLPSDVRQKHGDHVDEWKGVAQTTLRALDILGELFVEPMAKQNDVGLWVAKLSNEALETVSKQVSESLNDVRALLNPLGARIHEAIGVLAAEQQRQQQQRQAELQISLSTLQAELTKAKDATLSFVSEAVRQGLLSATVERLPESLRNRYESGMQVARESVQETMLALKERELNSQVAREVLSQLSSLISNEVIRQIPVVDEKTITQVMLELNGLQSGIEQAAKDLESYRQQKLQQRHEEAVRELTSLVDQAKDVVAPFVKEASEKGVVEALLAYVPKSTAEQEKETVDSTAEGVEATATGQEMTALGEDNETQDQGQKGEEVTPVISDIDSAAQPSKTTTKAPEKSIEVALQQGGEADRVAENSLEVDDSELITRLPPTETVVSQKRADIGEQTKVIDTLANDGDVSLVRVPPRQEQGPKISISAEMISASEVAKSGFVEAKTNSFSVNNPTGTDPKQLTGSTLAQEPLTQVYQRPLGSDTSIGAGLVATPEVPIRPGQGRELSFDARGYATVPSFVSESKPTMTAPELAQNAVMTEFARSSPIRNESPSAPSTQRVHTGDRAVAGINTGVEVTTTSSAQPVVLRTEVGPSHVAQSTERGLAKQPEGSQPVWTSAPKINPVPSTSQTERAIADKRAVVTQTMQSSETQSRQESSATRVGSIPVPAAPVFKQLSAMPASEVRVVNTQESLSSTAQVVLPQASAEGSQSLSSDALRVSRARAPQQETPRQHEGPVAYDGTPLSQTIKASTVPGATTGRAQAGAESPVRSLAQPVTQPVKQPDVQSIPQLNVQPATDATSIQSETTESSDFESMETLSADSGRRDQTRRKKKLSDPEQKRLREIIMQQLLTQTFEKAKREKLLRMLASLGLTEQEYRAFLARLSTVEVSRQDAAMIKKVESAAVAIESFAKPAAPTIKASSSNEKPSSDTRVVTRGDLYARLKKGGDT